MRRRCRNSTPAPWWTASAWRRRSRRCTARSLAGTMLSCISTWGGPWPSRSDTPASCWTRFPPRHSDSFAGVGYHLDLAALEPGEAVLDLGSGSGTDVFCAAVRVGQSGRVVGVDITDEQLAKASPLARPRRVLAGRARGGPHRTAPLRGRQLRRGHLERRHQPLAAQGPGLRRGCPGAAARRAAGDLGHGQRARAQGTHADATSTSGPPASRARFPATSTSRRSRPRASESSRYGTTTTASPRSGRSRPAASTRSRASRCVPSKPARRIENRRPIWPTRS